MGHSYEEEPVSNPWVNKKDQPAKRIDLGEIEPYGNVRLVLAPKLDKGYLHLGPAQRISEIKTIDLDGKQIRHLRLDSSGNLIGIEFETISQGLDFGRAGLPPDLQDRLFKETVRAGYGAWDDVGLVLIHNAEEAEVWKLNDDDITGIGHARMTQQLRRAGLITGPTYKQTMAAAREERRKQKESSS